MATGDLNGDGIDDIVIAAPNLSNSFLLIYYGTNGLGITAEANKKQIINTANYYFGASMSVLDVDHDGYDDLIVSSDYYQIIHIYWGAASGIIEQTKSTIHSQYCSNGFCTGIINIEKIDDINRDGRPDLAFSEAISYPRTTDNVFVLLTKPELREQLTINTSTTLGDIADYMISGNDGEGLGYEEDPVVQTGHNIASIKTPQHETSDGLIVGTYSGGVVYFFDGATLTEKCAIQIDLNSGSSHGCTTADATQTIAKPENSDSQKFGRALAVLDYDNDGLDDLFIGMPSEDSFEEDFVFDNDIVLAKAISHESEFTFDLPAQFNAVDFDRGFFGENLIPANLLGDGYEALIVGGYSTVDDRLHIFWNSAANGLSREHGSILEGPATFGYSLATGDFNGDGKLDLAVGAPSCDGCDGSGDKNGEFHVYY